MVRVVVTFFAVWLAIGVIGVLVQRLLVPIPNEVVSLTGLIAGLIGAALVYRQRRAAATAAETRSITDQRP